jgi:hypothetical protein
MGIATYSGEVADPQQGNDSVAGVLGAYIGDLRTDKQNTEHNQKFEGGWARWSGASFAAPQIAGALAALVGLQPSIILDGAPQSISDRAAAEQAMRMVDPLLSTQVGEDIFPVSHGAAPLP